jgi:hypothetical protein
MPSKENSKANPFIYWPALIVLLPLYIVGQVCVGVGTIIDTYTSSWLDAIECPQDWKDL